MPKMPAFLSKLPRRTLWIVLTVVVLAAAEGHAYYKLNPATTETTDQTTL